MSGFNSSTFKADRSGQDTAFVLRPVLTDPKAAPLCERAEIATAPNAAREG